MADENDPAENLSTVGSGRIDALFDDVESTITHLDVLADELESVRRRIEANDGETSGHVRNRINDDADQLAVEAANANDRVQSRLRALKRLV